MVILTHDAVLDLEICQLNMETQLDLIDLKAWSSLKVCYGT